MVTAVAVRIVILRRIVIILSSFARLICNSIVVSFRLVLFFYSFFRYDRSITFGNNGFRFFFCSNSDFYSSLYNNSILTISGLSGLFHR